LLDDLERYCIIFPDKEDLQDKWGAVVNNGGKYVNLMVGLLTDDNIRAARAEENHVDEEPWNRVTKYYFLTYHQVKAHLHWLGTRPDEAEHYRRFQVSKCLLYVLQHQHAIVTNQHSCLYSCGTASKRWNTWRLGIHWGLMGMGYLGLLRWWEREVGGIFQTLT
jgi:hypothetical protein